MTRAWQLALVAWLVTSGPVAAQDPAAEQVPERPRDLFVVSGRSATGFESAHEGLAARIRERLAGARLRVHDGARSRQAGQTGKLDTPALLERASSEQSGRALLVDLWVEPRALHIGLRLYELDTKTLIGVARDTTTRGELWRAGDTALLALLPKLSVQPLVLPKRAAQDIGELSIVGRALAAMDRGDLVRAWNELEGRRSPAVNRLRRTVQRLAEDPATPPAMRARLLSARGNSEGAWNLIAEQVEQQPPAQTSDTQLLLAASEIYLERGKPDQALLHAARLTLLEPANLDAQIALGRAHALMGDKAAARAVFQKAAAIEVGSPRPIELHAELASESRDERAELLLVAGDRAAASLNAQRALESYGRAMRLNPTRAAEFRERAGQLHQILQDHQAALDAYSDATTIEVPTASRIKGIARAQRGLGDLPAAQELYSQALELEPDDSESLLELGQLHRESNQPQMALPLLTHALAMEPTDPEVHRSLARVHHELGEDAMALELYARADELGGATPISLGEAAAIDQARGNLDAASHRLERALELDPANVELREGLAALHRERGDEMAAARTELNPLPEAAEAAAETEAGEPAPPGERAGDGSPAPPLAELSESFAGLVDSFGEPDPELGPVGLLGLRESNKDLELVLSWLRPKRVHLQAVYQQLVAAIRERYAVAAVDPRHTLELRSTIELLYHFEGTSGLSAATVSRVNRGLGTGAVFVARLGRSKSAESLCGPGAFELELRLLTGALASEASALGNSMCLPAEIESRGPWNYRAAGIYGCLLLLLLYPFLRGWGTVVVTFQFPPKMRHLFNVRLSRSRVRPVKMDDTGDHDANKGKIEEKLKRSSMFEKPLQGDRMVFRRVPARRKYWVTVRGPMIDSLSGDAAGAFQEQRQVSVARGKKVIVDFDLRPKEAAIEVSVYDGEQLAKHATVGLRGNPASQVYARAKPVYLYAQPGEHVLIAAVDGRLAEKTVRVDSTDAVQVSFNLAELNKLVFDNCPEAVVPYLAGDFTAVSEALEGSGDQNLAHAIRAQALADSGDARAASLELEAAGDLQGAAELRAQTDDAQGSAILFEEAGDYTRAADAYREQGDVVGAARAYERAHDLDNAILCYRELGDTESLVTVLEKAGHHYEAAEASQELGQTDRAMHNYRVIDQQDPRYGDACCRLGILFQQKGELDLAIEKLEEARERLGGDLFPLPVYHRLASLFEECDRLEEAVATFDEIRRRDPDYSDVRDRAESLRGRISGKEKAERQTTGGATIAETVAMTGPATESRYEILGELGRGGMGVVYRARDTNLGRIVALKVLPQNLKDHPTAVSMFLREARSAAALNHPNIVTLFDAGQEGDNYFITMECLEGTGFDGLLTAYGALPARDVALLGVQCALGLAYAHSQRIIHRDIKTSNLFYTNDRVVKIMDFGLAKAVEEVRKNASMIAGTPYFMSPEQSAGEVVDHRSDLYSLGVTLYQLTTGTVPFQDGDVTYHHRHTPAPDPREHKEETPEALARLLLRLLAKDPDERYQSSQDLAEELRQIAQDLA